jgi:capsular polysaccharide export protein
MSYKILFFATNRHQETYYKKLMKIVRKGDEGTLIHKRVLTWKAPTFKVNKADLDLIKTILLIRLAYFYNITGRKSNPFWRVTMSGLYFLSTLMFILKIRNLLSSKQFDIIVLWNDMKWQQYVVKKLALNNNIKTVFFENGALPNTVTLDPKGVNYNNSVPREKSFYMATPSEYPDQSCISKHVTINKGYIFVPFQVDYDTQIISHSPWIKNMEVFYYTLERLLASLPTEMSIVIKEHPKSSRNYGYLHQRNPRISFNNTTSTDVLVRNSSIVMTVNSTVGLEAIINDKPTVVLGNAFYGIDGLCQVVKNERALISKMRCVDVPDKEIKAKFLEYLGEYYVAGDWHSPTVDYIQNIENRIDEQLESK